MNWSVVKDGKKAVAMFSAIWALQSKSRMKQSDELSLGVERVFCSPSSSSSYHICHLNGLLIRCFVGLAVLCFPAAVLGKVVVDFSCWPLSNLTYDCPLCLRACRTETKVLLHFGHFQALPHIRFLDFIDSSTLWCQVVLAHPFFLQPWCVHDCAWDAVLFSSHNVPNPVAALLMLSC